MNGTGFETESEVQEFYLNVLSTSTLVTFSSLYLWFVFASGPRVMKNQEPYKIIQLVRMYNLYQVVVCTVTVVRAHQLGFSMSYLWKCEKFGFVSDVVRLEVKIGFYLFMLLRMFEYMETVFFILRKKMAQASFLHVFHHIGSTLMTWLFIMSRAELNAVYIALLNSYVHIMMYFYYFLSSYKNRELQGILKVVKPFITIIQLVQFIVIIGHCVVAILPGCDCGYFFHLQIFNFVVLFVLFSHFFVQTYVRKRKDAKESFQLRQS